jgi:hypothetical protein
LEADQEPSVIAPTFLHWLEQTIQAELADQRDAP